ncbi:MAG: hypothetical protein WCF79_17160 [Rhodomicrobium sp.]
MAGPSARSGQASGKRRGTKSRVAGRCGGGNLSWPRQDTGSVRLYILWSSGAIGPPSRAKRQAARGPWRCSRASAIGEKPVMADAVSFT